MDQLGANSGRNRDIPKTVESHTHTHTHTLSLYHGYIVDSFRARYHRTRKTNPHRLEGIETTDRLRACNIAPHTPHHRATSGEWVYVCVDGAVILMRYIPLSGSR
jgi:hypothetical protein